jgi:phage-related protein
MEMDWKAEYVELENGKVPFKDFIDKLDIDAKIDILAMIDELIEWKNNKLFIPISKSKYLRDKIFEMRTRHKSIISRSLYFFFDGEKIVFTHGFIKKTNKTPNSEIEKAKKLRDYYISFKRKNNDL